MTEFISLLRPFLRHFRSILSRNQRRECVYTRDLSPLRANLFISTRSKTQFRLGNLRSFAIRLRLKSFPTSEFLSAPRVSRRDFFPSFDV